MIATMQDNRESVNCIFCGQGQAELYAKAKSLYDSRQFTVVQCPRCKLVYTSPRIANKALEVASHQPPSAEMFDEAHVSERAAAAQMQLRRVERVIRPGKLLDFGCGDGTLVHEACRRGWDAVGSDIDLALVRAANEHWSWQRLVSDDMDTLVGKFAGQFDAIISKQVFEHLTNPLAFLVRMRSLLKPGGVVLVDVPNLRCLAERRHRGATLDPTAHLYYFTPQTLRLLFEKAGFGIVRCSGSPNFLGTYYRICRTLGAGGMAPRLSAITQHLPLPQIGAGVYAIARIKGLSPQCATCRGGDCARCEFWRQSTPKAAATV